MHIHQQISKNKIHAHGNRQTLGDGKNGFEIKYADQYAGYI
ncbi:hypothetical protein [Sphingobacterium sp. IITKGP-BTPF85]|nr:hypothetical protein [Sphingobacterium sp. IITKGP-BTPF85]